MNLHFPCVVTDPGPLDAAAAEEGTSVLTTTGLPEPTIPDMDLLDDETRAVVLQRARLVAEVRGITNAAAVLYSSIVVKER